MRMEVFLELFYYGVGIFVVGLVIGYQVGKKVMLKDLERKEV